MSVPVFLDPTETITPTVTVTPTPMPGVSWYHDVQMNATFTAAAVWAVLILFVFVLLVRPQMRTIQIFEILVIVTFPLMILNVGYWVMTMYFFTAVYMIFNALGRISA